jgi:MFS family permease
VYHFRQSLPYSPQIWLLFWGTLFGSLGMSLVWPFLTIYIREQLDIPLSQITPLFTLQAVTGLAAATLISPLMDLVGRKGPMIAGTIASALTMIAMSRAGSYAAWAVLLPAYAVVNAAFRIGSYTMAADLVEPEHRARVYALLRTGDNVGIALGPALGGFLVAVAYRLSYYAAAVTQLGLALGVFLLLTETLARAQDDTPLHTAGLGYGPLLRDRPFLVIWGLYVLVNIAGAMVFTLLGVYVKEHYGIPENRYGFIIGTNAVMVVLLQYGVTRTSTRYPPLAVIVAGSLFYAAGMGGFALSRGFVAFLAAMVLFTLGELLLVPTATALVANIAPPAMRARYMGIFTLTFRVSAGIGPVLGGLLNDLIAPSATWYGGMAACLVAAAGYGWLVRHDITRPDQTPVLESKTVGDSSLTS